jgi:tetratricopeptide (TPR) repeat protein
MMKMNPDAAIISFEKAVKLADEVGAEADEIKDQASKQIPKMYWESAKALAGKKDYDGALAKLDACIETSEKVGDKEQASRAGSTALTILNAQGSTALNAKDYDNALGYFDSALAREPRYAKAYLGKVLAYDGMGDYDRMEETALLGIEAAKASRDAKTSGDIEKKVRATFFNNAQESMKSKDYASAIDNLNKSIEFGNSSSITYYQLGLAQEGIEKWNDAIVSFNKAIELEMGGDGEKAKVYFELGKSYQAVSDVANACASYKKALVGEFAEAAKYQIETVLQCSN